MTPAFSELAPAKINLTLAVHGRQPDGYHALESLVGFVELADTVTWHSGAAPTRCSGAFADAIEGENLLDRLGQLWPSYASTRDPGRFSIIKELPVAAGVGGGSADAGAALRLLQRAHPELAEQIDWAALAAQLGSDVPACWAARPAILFGRGTHLRKVPALPPLPLILANPGVAALSDKTARVFRELGALTLSEPPPPPNGAAYAGVSGTDGLIELMRQQGNALTEAAIRVTPAIEAVLATLKNMPGARYAAITGAGPTCFVVMPTPAAADAAARTLSVAQPDWWIAATNLLPT